MTVWKGKISNGVAQQNTYSQNMNVMYYIITNMSNTTITLNVKIRISTVDTIQIMPLDMQLIPGESITGNDIVVLANEALLLNVAGGQVDYYFLMNPI